MKNMDEVWGSNDPEDGWSSLVFPWNTSDVSGWNGTLFPIFSYHSGMKSWTKLETISFFLTIKVSFLSFHTIFSGISLISSIHHWILRHLRPLLESPGQITHGMISQVSISWYMIYDIWYIYIISNNIHIMFDIHRHSMIINSLVTDEFFSMTFGILLVFFVVFDPQNLGIYDDLDPLGMMVTEMPIRIG